MFVYFATVAINYFPRAVLGIIFYLPFIMAMALFGHKGLFVIHTIYYWILSKICSKEKDKIYNATANLHFFLSDNNQDQKKCKKIAYQATKLHSLESYRATFNHKVSNSASYKKVFNAIEIETSQSIADLYALSKERKIIFVYNHGANRIMAIQKLIKSSDEEKASKHLIIHRGFAKKVLDNFDSLAVDYGCELFYINTISEDYSRQFIKYFRQVDCIHVLFDLPQPYSFSNYKCTTVNLLNKEALFLTGFAEMALFAKSVVVPVYSMGDYAISLKIMPIIYPDQLNVINKQEACNRIVQIVVEQFEWFIKHKPQYWTLLNYLHLFYTKAKFLK